MDLKMKQLDELETMLEKERETIENQRRQLIAERQQFHMEQIKSIEAARARDQNMRDETQRPPGQPGPPQQPPPPGQNRFPPQQYQGAPPPQQQQYPAPPHQQASTP